MKQWHEILFDAFELTCYSANLKDTFLSSPLYDSEQFFCINPLNKKRSDAHVSAFRSILVEFDVGTISEQRKILDDSKLPYSVLTYSGGKSLHAIVSVEPAFGSEEEYRTVAKAIYAKLPGCDTKVCNPSRFSRTPGCIRDNGVEQTLLELRSRVSQDELLKWIGPIQLPKARLELPKELWGARMLPVRVRAFLNYGAAKGGRNTALFQNSCEMFRAGFSEDEIYSMVSDSPLDLPDHEIRTCIRSARKASNQ